MEFGETFEECARREVREECGIAIENVSLRGTVNTIDRDRGYHGVVLIMAADAKSVGCVCRGSKGDRPCLSPGAN